MDRGLSVYGDCPVGIDDHAVTAVIERDVAVGVRIGDARRQCIWIDCLAQRWEVLGRSPLRGRHGLYDRGDDGAVAIVRLYNGW
ncbi:hypothetical protein SAMN05443574_11738 [Haloarcula vallismortis]|uniref:Uncharacterized protein n=1 Tax=Haloarcula vallismortis TaxID=28442 RepID=A0A1H2ZLP3_HALVA|nr:hypothetical protein SAMN05443574_11738 [Haloarcula vallismortis]